MIDTINNNMPPWFISGAKKHFKLRKEILLYSHFYAESDSAEETSNSKWGEMVAKQGKVARENTISKLEKLNAK